MQESKIFEGKTTNEAIENGLKALGLRREDAEIKILEEEKRSFFSILAPRVVKVEIKAKEEKIQERKQDRFRKDKYKKREQEEFINIDFNKATENVEKFLNQWLKTIPGQDVKFEIKPDNQFLKIDLNGEDLNYLIGHRGETLDHLQNILSVIASRDLEYKVKVVLNICGYKEKREKALIELAQKLEKTVAKTRKSITLEPMTSYERKIIHSKLQHSRKVITTSIGEEPYRKVVISVKE